MKNNMSPTDRIIRAVIAVVFGILIFAKLVTGISASIFGVIAVVLAVTALVGFCPLYSLLKISTKKS